MKKISKQAKRQQCHQHYLLGCRGGTRGCGWGRRVPFERRDISAATEIIVRTSRGFRGRTGFPGAGVSLPVF
ncbi:unnamed protein product [Dovyalis caffra]|uniref:Uncharacterized protein n=1 Tax=Dovyalis caffra TaxID=77055 RepID=A0AAV1S329_9ROSI|nr:unnamed protein product [Dovyalis caffra]